MMEKANIPKFQKEVLRPSAKRVCRHRCYASSSQGRFFAYYCVLRWYTCGCHIRVRVYQSKVLGREQIVWCKGCFGHRPQQKETRL